VVIRHHGFLTLIIPTIGGDDCDITAHGFSLSLVGTETKGVIGHQLSYEAIFVCMPVLEFEHRPVVILHGFDESHHVLIFFEVAGLALHIRVGCYLILDVEELEHLKGYFQPTMPRVGVE
tara:strand:- start:632 stop:991 length:360 start_codon:yes stop_codon:yes gene_type:complete